jgi:hypothetical protein
VTCASVLLRSDLDLDGLQRSTVVSDMVFPSCSGKSIAVACAARG